MGLGWASYHEAYGPVNVPTRASVKWRLKLLKSGVTRNLPKAWQSSIELRARESRASVRPGEGDGAAGDEYGRWLREYAGADAADMGEGGIRGRAEVIADRARAARFVPTVEGWAWAAWARLCEFIHKYAGSNDMKLERYKLDSLRARAECRTWWRKQLRRMVARSYEAGAIALGQVGAAANQWYCSDRAVKRRIQQVQANNEAMRAAKIESASGQAMSIWDAAQLSVSNKAIRRGELMTRIRGCEVWAESQGLVGMFTTNTCPSRFHSQRKGGGGNPRYDGSKPSDAQSWLCKTWARCRSKLAREGLGIVGFRVAEPHHDGTPHWHMLLWCRADQYEEIERLICKWWLKDEGSERGADKYRVNCKRMIGGQASGYIAKYISKNIDDVHTHAHVDQDEVPGMTVGPDLFGELEVLPCQRVEAWASLWGIRQFQAIGQPPVTVWREFRRVNKQDAVGSSDDFLLAWASCHRRKDVLADWAGYIGHQGGVMMRREDYRYCVNRLEKERAGRYGAVREKWAAGVLDRRERAGREVVATRRERWGGSGFAAQGEALPWTRFNNCTQRLTSSAMQRVREVGSMVENGLMDVEGGWFSDDGRVEDDPYMRVF